MYPNRVMCDVLEEMRNCFKTYNFSPILGLIEEVQSMANRMESGLSDVHDITELHDRKKHLDNKCKILQREAQDLRAIIEKKVGEEGYEK